MFENCFGFIGAILSQCEGKQYYPITEVSTRDATELLCKKGEFYRFLLVIGSD